MVEKVRNYLEKLYQIQSGDVIVAGVSGGADSICLLCVLHELCAASGARLHAVHVNHNIRREASADQRFVEEFCKDRGIECHIYSYPVKEYARDHKISTEEAGRRLRYGAFEETLKKLLSENERGTEGNQTVRERGIIAVAHTMDDNAETMLLNLFRGTGLKGLGGIPARRGSVIRPLLCIRRSEIEAWLKLQGIVWCEDATNDTDDYARNRIRHKMIPAAENEINERAVEHMNRTAAQLVMAEDYLSGHLRKAFTECVQERKDGILILSEPVMALHPYIRQRLLLEAMERTAGTARDIGEVHIKQMERLFSLQCGKQMQFAYGMKAVRTYEGILLKRRQVCLKGKEREEKTAEAAVWNLKITGDTEIPGYGFFRTRWIDQRNFIEIPKDGYTKWLDYDKIKGTVLVRTRQEGDYLTINKAGNTQKLKSYLVNEKIPSEQRDKLLLVADGQHIVWIPGYRFDQAYYINASTRKILEIQFTENG